MKTIKSLFILALVPLAISCSSVSSNSTTENASLPEKEDKGFPFEIQHKKPNIKLSHAMERNYDAYMGIQPKYNELYTQFKYTELKGLDYSNHDGTVTRRDPSKV
ncbi:MAG: glycoside hydrolase, partial [Flavicella sp.]|nr:glycoside hydrolase [Flavicella sp.]